MTTGQLIANLNLTLLSDVNLSHFQNTGRQVITNSDGKLTTALFCCKTLVLADIIHNQALDEAIDMCIIGPVAALNTVIFKVHQSGNSKLAALCDNFSISIILNTGTCLILCKRDKLINKHALQLLSFCLILFINMLQGNLVLFLRLTILNSAREHFLINNNTTKRRISLQRRVFRITSLVAEDGTEKFLLW